jgi:Ariadne domain
MEEPIEANPFDPTSDEGYGTAIYSAREAWKAKQESNRVIHHYTRWEAHAQSASLERKMQDSVCSRLAPVVEAATTFDGSPVFNFGGHGLSFVHAAFTELLECRSMLQHSYAFSYFRYPTFSRSAHVHAHLYGKRKEKQSFERLQAGNEIQLLVSVILGSESSIHLCRCSPRFRFRAGGGDRTNE